MVKIGYHASHEQFSPASLLDYVKKAEKAGFQLAHCSDHFHPWSRQQGQSGFAWSWLGAAMSQTSFKFGIVNCPAYRYHPAIIAQAAATLDVMFPGRFWISIGSGQSMNEAVVGGDWPGKEERNTRLKESADIIRALWKGETVTKKGLIEVKDATLYTRPESNIPLFGAAITPETAAWLATWADGMITISQPIEKLTKVVDAWKSHGGENKPMILKIQLSYDLSKEEARQGAFEQWRTNIFGSDMLAELRTPQQFEQAAELVKPEDMDEFVDISHEPEQHIEWMEQYKALGFRELVLHNVNRKQEQFIETFGEKVLPHFKQES